MSIFHDNILILVLWKLLKTIMLLFSESHNASAY